MAEGKRANKGKQKEKGRVLLGGFPRSAVQNEKRLRFHVSPFRKGGCISTSWVKRKKWREGAERIDKEKRLTRGIACIRGREEKACGKKRSAVWA